MNKCDRNAQFDLQLITKNRTELSCAMSLSEPMSRNSSTNVHERTTAATGFSRKRPRPTTKARAGPNMTSFATASRTRLEPMRLLRLALKVARRTPMATAGGQKDMLVM
jgi:hypothetical protein